MKRPKGFLQKVSLVSGIVSFVLAIVCAVWLYLRVSALGDAHDPISASIGASIFFFVSVGVVLLVIGRADLPNLKFDK